LPAASRHERGDEVVLGALDLIGTLAELGDQGVRHARDVVTRDCAVLAGAPGLVALARRLGHAA
jgi:hypothetical protein